MTKRMSPWIVAISLFAAVCALPAGAAEEKQGCRLKRVAALPVDGLEMNRIHVPATLAENPTYLIVDTGGFKSFIFEAFVKAAGLKVVTATVPIASDGSGASMRKGVWIKPIQIGNLRTEDEVSFLLGPGGNEKTLNGEPVAGTFGADFLKNYDIELDFGKKLVGFFNVSKCNPQFAYWAQEWVEMPFDNRKDLIYVDVEVNGKKLRALVDTGAPTSVLDISVAKKEFGLTEKTMTSSGHAYWAAGKKTESYRAKLDSLSMEGIIVQNTEIEVTDMGGEDMILGMTHLKKLRMFIAYSQGKIFATPAQ